MRKWLMAVAAAVVLSVVVAVAASGRDEERQFTPAEARAYRQAYKFCSAPLEELALRLRVTADVESVAGEVASRAVPPRLAPVMAEACIDAIHGFAGRVV